VWGYIERWKEWEQIFRDKDPGSRWVLDEYREELGVPVPADRGHVLPGNHLRARHRAARASRRDSNLPAK